LSIHAQLCAGIGWLRYDSGDVKKFGGNAADKLRQRPNGPTRG
jgi:hypothetical protein